nr:reverse transcriptase domain-containing protein [Tanacetum cinerariifolium]
GNVGEPSKDRNGKDDNKRTRTVNAFATTVNPVGRENMGPCHTCFNCNRPSHLAKDCRGVPRNVNLVNARNSTVRACYECGSTNHVRSACHRLNRVQGLGGNRPNQVVANNEGQGRGNQGNQARSHAMVEAGHAAYTNNIHELARLVPHLVTPESSMIKRYVYGLASQIRGMVAAMKPKTIQNVV